MLRDALEKGKDIGIHLVAAVAAVPIGLAAYYDHAERMRGKLRVLESVDAPDYMLGQIRDDLENMPGVVWYVKSAYDGLAGNV